MGKETEKYLNRAVTCALNYYFSSELSGGMCDTDLFSSLKSEEAYDVFYQKLIIVTNARQLFFHFFLLFHFAVETTYIPLCFTWIKN